MQSLFSRVFVSFWIAILVFVIAATVLTAVNFRAGAGEPRAVTREAALVLQEGGLDDLKQWLAARNARYRTQRTFVLDASGREILGQELPPRLQRMPPGRPRPRENGGPQPPPADPSAESRMPPPPPAPGGLPGPGDARGQPPGPPFASIIGPGGARYVVHFDPPPRRGPFSPPFSDAARLFLLVLAIAISGIVSYVLARSISRPLEGLQDAARELAAGRLDARATPQVADRRDELGSLAREFNAMADRLAGLIAARQQLLRDLSHELRSPLARLRLAVGLARQPGGDADRELDRIERESERLESLIAQILSYARLERDPSTLETQSTDVAAIVQQVVHDARYESQATAAQLQLRAAAAPVELQADPGLLHAAVDNIVRNALRHGGTGPIEVALQADGGEITIAVRDHGPGVPETDLERIFEPFYRVSAETPGRRREGTGIGLAIAAKAVGLHGGRLQAENAEQGGLRVTMTLPRRPPQHLTRTPVPGPATGRGDAGTAPA